MHSCFQVSINRFQYIRADKLKLNFSIIAPSTVWRVITIPASAFRSGQFWVELDSTGTTGSPDWFYLAPDTWKLNCGL
jgi:hypothetical protein